MGDRDKQREAGRERDVVCVTQFCVLMEDSTAISSSALSQHHHRDNKMRKISAETRFKSMIEVTVFIQCSRH